MCRLFGMVSMQPVSPAYYLLEAPRPFRAFGDRRNPDGWGLAWYEDGRPLLFKEACPAPRSAVFAPLTKSVTARFFVAHVRKASRGDLRRHNCHPFLYQQWAFAHNGTIKHADEWRRALRPFYRALLAGDTDSEIYFLTLLQAIADSNGDVVAGIRRVTRRLKDFTGANFILTDGRRMFAYRRAAVRPRYFSLYYRIVRRPLPGCRTAFDPRGAPHVAVASNKLDDAAWRSLPQDCILEVGADLACREICLVKARVAL